MESAAMLSSDWRQDPPRLGNQWTDDVTLRQMLSRLLPNDVLATASPDLEAWGAAVAGHVKALGRQAEEEPPHLQQYDAWGHRRDALRVSPAWTALKGESARQGLVAIAYERPYGQHSRMVQAAKLVLFGASSGLYNCPLAMTDGAARLCELLAPQLPELLEPLEHLTSRDPQRFWTSGQWMTEAGGGSDVASATATLATPLDTERNGEAPVGSWFALTGFKWFSSAADGEIAMALARDCGADGRPLPGTAGLSLFYVPVRRDEHGAPMGFELVRLKNKLGTRQLPTAELRLTGIRALKISRLGRGVAAISPMLSITRLYNAAAAVSYMRRICALTVDYARRRRVFGKLLCEQPLALCTLAWMEVCTSGSLALLMEAARLLGKQETGQASKDDASNMRLLVPLLKAWTAKEAVAVVSEGLEFFGGQGYVEDSGIPGLLRDAQVLPIWEGTTAVQSLDLLRVLAHNPSASATWLASANARLAAAVPDCQSAQPTANGALRYLRVAVERLLDGVERGVGATQAAESVEAAEAGCRDLAMLWSKAWVALLLLEHAAWAAAAEPREGMARAAAIAAEWCRRAMPGGGDEAGPDGAALLAAARLIVQPDRPLSEPRGRF